MEQDIPKQFLNVYDKPVVIYTLESFQRHPEIDAIEVVCLEGWSEILWAYAKQFNITKLKWVVPGGKTVQESIRNGVFGLREICGPKDIVVIHDGIRPLVDDFVLSDVLVTCRQYGNGVSSMPYYEQIFVIDEDKISTTEYIPRDTLRRVSAPQAYYFDKLLWAYEQTVNGEVGLQSSAYTNTLMSDLGERLYFAAGSDRNIKLTTKSDLEFFKCYVKMEKDSWLK